MDTLVETYGGRTEKYTVTDSPMGTYDPWQFVNRANAELLAQGYPDAWHIPGYIVPERENMSWLTSFLNVLHAVEAANQLAAPIVSAVLGGTDGPAIAGMMLQGNAAAVGIEAISATMSIPMTGEQKGAVVDAGTQATFTLINSILTSQGKKPLAATVPAAVSASVKTVVEGLKTVGATVGPLTPPPNTPTA